MYKYQEVGCGIPGNHVGAPPPPRPQGWKLLVYGSGLRQVPAPSLDVSYHPWTQPRSGI